MISLQEAIEPIIVKETIGSIANIFVNRVTYDSRKVQNENNRYVFVGIEGYKESGTKYIQQAIEQGAVAVVTQENPQSPLPVPLILVEDTRSALAKIATRIHNYPSDHLKIIGVTGTNGKTTITYMLESIFRAATQSIGVLGTIEYRLGAKILPAPTTTPQASDLQEFLAEMVRQDFRYVVMEVSSHALELRRTEGCEFDVGIFTNLTRDHLDFHRTMEQYLEAKMKLFLGLGNQRRKGKQPYAVVNGDDPAAGTIISRMPQSVRIIVYGIEAKEAHLQAKNIVLAPGYTTFTLLGNGQEISVRLKISGKHNVYNALAACGAALSQGVSLKIIKKGLEDLECVPGRFERIDAGQTFTVVVDYAHTDDALENVLQAARQLSPRRIITVFGAGGDRDRTKRPLMGQVVTRFSDFCFVTSDNPRSEDPEKIALDIELGIKRIGQTNYAIELDRQSAIEKALAMAEKGDFILIAGKGHENYQIFKNRVVHFDDREKVREILQEYQKSNIKMQIKNKI